MEIQIENLKQRNRLLHICYGSFILLGLTLTIPATSLKFIAQTFNLNYAQRGIFLAFNFFAYLTSIVVGGLFSDKISRKAYLTSGLYILFSGLLLEAFSPNCPLLLTGALLVGWGNGAIQVLINPIISDMFPKERASKLNTINFFYNFGVVVGAIAAGCIIVKNMGWRPSFLIISLCSLFLAISSNRTQFIEENNPVTIKIFILKLFKNRLFLMLSIAMFLAAGLELGVCSWLPNYMNERFNLSALAGGLSLALFSLSMGIGRLIYSRLTEHYNHCLLMEISSTGSFFCIISAVVTKSSLITIISFGLLGLFLSGLWPTILAYASFKIEGPSVPLFSLIVICAATGTLLFPYLIGVISNQSTFKIGLSILTIPPLISMFIFRKLYRERNSLSSE